MRKKATIEIQKGLVCQNTIISAKGAKGTAHANSKKFPYPVIHLVNMAPLFSQGNILSGFKSELKHQMQAHIKAIMFLSKLNSAGWKPCSATTLNVAAIAAVDNAATFIAKIAISLLSLTLAGTWVRV